MTNTYKVVFSYKGSSFSGFQRQPGNQRTVEGEFLKALRRLLKQNISIVASGRTDAGVHAEGQVVSFSCDCSIPLNSMHKALNSMLPEDIRVRSVDKVEANFHARYSAKTREYRYLFTDSKEMLFLEDFVTRVNFIPKVELFPLFAPHIVGTRDFDLFKCKGSTEFSTIKHIYLFELFEYNYPCVYNTAIEHRLYCLRIVGNSFLYKMVRNLTGAIFEVLRGKREICEFSELMQPNPRPYRFTTVPPTGLSLYKVNYE